MTVKIGVIQRVYKQNRFVAECFEENGKMSIGFNCIEPAFLFSFLERNLVEIESVEFWANASPVPPDMLEAVGKMKKLVGEERCI
jgi:hypothetical protein